jgi:hypothetical protein
MVGRQHAAPITAHEAASTLFRFFRSEHVVDLKLIFAFTLPIAATSGGIALIGLMSMLVGIKPIEDRLGPAAQTYAVPLFAFCCLIIGWAYRSASARLGVVDLFACEIATLCRVGTVFDIGKHFVALYEPAEPRLSQRQAPTTGRLPQDAGPFVSQEQYFPVFDSNSRDLQLLEARVVNDIVAFYTYMKAMRDSLRRLASIEAAHHDTVATTPTGLRDESQRQLAILNVIYMTYLAYESGRLAIESLVEFDPAKAENCMVVLITELTCYAFLVRCFGESDLRRKRLELRRKGYENEVEDLCRAVGMHAESDIDWLPAIRTVPELRRRFDEMLMTPSC